MLGQNDDMVEPPPPPPTMGMRIYRARGGGDE